MVTKVAVIGGGIIGTHFAEMARHGIGDKGEIRVYDPDAFTNWSDRRYSTHYFHNAGTGHAGNCEPYGTDMSAGTYDPEPALNVHEKFARSSAYWMHLGGGKIPGATSCAHLSMAIRPGDIEMQRKRHKEVAQHHFFADLEFSEDLDQISNWSPLITMGRTNANKMAVTHTKKLATDINFSRLQATLQDVLAQDKRISWSDNQIKGIDRTCEHAKPPWCLTFKKGSEKEYYDLIFIAAGGETLPLLQKTGLADFKGYGAFPVSGEFLVAKTGDNEQLNKHTGKVYGFPPSGSTPMSVPHLDERSIEGEKYVMFGPYAGLAWKFIRQKIGRKMSLPRTFFKSPPAYLKAGLKEFGLMKYLASEVLTSEAAKRHHMHVFCPATEQVDGEFEIVPAGIRTQLLERNGQAIFGTRILGNQEAGIAGLVGASPGASISPIAALDALKSYFPGMYYRVREELSEDVPALFANLREDRDTYDKIIADYKKSFEV